MPILRHLAFLAGCLTFLLGSLNALFEAVSHGYFRGRKGVLIGLSGSPVQYLLGVLFFLGLSLLFGWLLWTSARGGLPWTASAHQDWQRRCKERAEAAALARAGRRWPTWVGLALLVLTLALMVMVRQSVRSDDKLAALLLGLLTLCTGVGGLLTLTGASNRKLSTLALVLLGALMFGSLLLR